MCCSVILSVLATILQLCAVSLTNFENYDRDYVPDMGAVRVAVVESVTRREFSCTGKKNGGYSMGCDDNSYVVCSFGIKYRMSCATKDLRFDEMMNSCLLEKYVLDCGGRPFVPPPQLDDADYIIADISSGVPSGERKRQKDTYLCIPVISCKGQPEGQLTDVPVGPCQPYALYCLGDEIAAVKQCKRGLAFIATTGRCEYRFNVSACSEKRAADYALVDFGCTDRRGSYRDPKYFCSQQYFSCSEFGGASQMLCPSDELFDEQTRRCQPASVCIRNLQSLLSPNHPLNSATSVSAEQATSADQSLPDNAVDEKDSQNELSIGAGSSKISQERGAVQVVDKISGVSGADGKAAPQREVKLSNEVHQSSANDAVNKGDQSDLSVSTAAIAGSKKLSQERVAVETVDEMDGTGADEEVVLRNKAELSSEGVGGQAANGESGFGKNGEEKNPSVSVFLSTQQPMSADQSPANDSSITKGGQSGHSSDTLTEIGSRNIGQGGTVQVANETRGANDGGEEAVLRNEETAANEAIDGQPTNGEGVVPGSNFTVNNSSRAATETSFSAEQANNVEAANSTVEFSCLGRTKGDYAKESCSAVFYRCLSSNGTQAVKFTCPSTPKDEMLFDPKNDRCVAKTKLDDCKGNTTVAEVIAQQQNAGEQSPAEGAINKGGQSDLSSDTPGIAGSRNVTKKRGAVQVVDEIGRISADEDAVLRKDAELSSERFGGESSNGARGEGGVTEENKNVAAVLSTQQPAAAEQSLADDTTTKGGQTDHADETLADAGSKKISQNGVAIQPTDGIRRTSGAGEEAVQQSQAELSGKGIEDQRAAETSSEDGVVEDGLRRADNFSSGAAEQADNVTAANLTVEFSCLGRTKGDYAKESCSAVFYRCLSGNETQAIKFTCPSTPKDEMLFDPDNDRCVAKTKLHDCQGNTTAADAVG